MGSGPAGTGTSHCVLAYHWRLGQRPAPGSSQQPQGEESNTLGRENHGFNPSPDSVTLVTLIKLQKATKQRNKDEIEVYDREAGARSSQNHFLAVSSSLPFRSLGNALMFSNLCETARFSRREQRSAFTAACCVGSYFTVKALGSPHLSQRNVPINMQILFASVMHALCRPNPWRANDRHQKQCLGISWKQKHI